ncbi:MAG: OsmC family protein [bacterium]|nr:OsmC family protein [bacterium]
MSEVKWIESMKFTAISDSGSKLVFEAPEEGKSPETNTFKPMEMLLLSLAGCTGMDVISILKKMRMEILEFKMTVEGKRREEHPKIYTEIKLHYHFKGKNLERDKIERAINLSQEKYCSVSAMLKQSSEVTFAYEMENI